MTKPATWSCFLGSNKDCVVLDTISLLWLWLWLWLSLSSSNISAHGFVKNWIAGHYWLEKQVRKYQFLKLCTCQSF